MERWEAKLLALFGCFVLPLVCTLLPKKLSSLVASWTDAPINNNNNRRGRRYKQVLGWLMCFGGGIFFGTYLLHMGPEVRTILKKSLLDPYHIDYPLPDLLVGLGFLLVLFAEKFVLRWNKRRVQSKAEKRAAAVKRQVGNDDDCTDHTTHVTAGNHREIGEGIAPNSDNSLESSLDPLTVTTSFYDNPAVDETSANNDSTSQESEASDTRGESAQSKTVSFSPVVNKTGRDDESLQERGEIENDQQQQLNSGDEELATSSSSVTLSLNEVNSNNNTTLDNNNKKAQHAMSKSHVIEGEDDVINNYINALCGEVGPQKSKIRGKDIPGEVNEEKEAPDVELGLKESRANHVMEKRKNGNAVNDLDSGRIIHPHHHNDNPHHHNDNHHDAEGHHHHHSTRSLILILALSLHRVFEGMSVGLQQSLHNIWSLFLAVMCHETVIGFSLGLQFVKSDLTTRRLLVTSLVCSSIMPVGVAIGMIMTETGGQSVAIEIANGVLQAVAMGTFIYVTFFEILQEELDPEDTSLGKITCVACGFFLMALLDLIPEEQALDVVVNNASTAV